MRNRSVLVVVFLSALVPQTAGLAETAPGLVIHKQTAGRQIPDKDPNEVVITDIAGWHHPTKAVFERYRMKLTKIELRWNKRYPVFHVADFGGDPTSGAAAKDFNKLNLDLLQANGFNSFMVVEDDYHDGFAIAYDRATHQIQSDLVQDVDP